MLFTKKVTTNINYQASPIHLTALQGDNCRALELQFYCGEEPWVLPPDGDVFIRYTCADGSGGIFDTLPNGEPAYILAGATLTIHIPEMMCAVPGVTKAQVTIFSDGAQISSFPIELRVLPQVGQKMADGKYVNLRKWLMSYVTEEPFVEAVVAALPSGDGVKY
ncbi:MAG: hypothetical protein E7447_01275 [Ruminococcaceae bacterium]|nr:hypothetical protein [Oscillospiraceae bacterium]